MLNNYIYGQCLNMDHLYDHETHYVHFIYVYVAIQTMINGINIGVTAIL